MLAILDTITRDDDYVIFVEAVNKVARKCQTASSLSFKAFQGVKGNARACERVLGVLLDGPREKRDCS